MFVVIQKEGVQMDNRIRVIILFLIFYICISGIYAEDEKELQVGINRFCKGQRQQSDTTLNKIEF